MIPAGNTPEKRVVHITGLEGVTYHFRLIAENLAGTSTTEDQTFDFNAPKGCPNHNVRQQTGAAYLPDCRAYELVSAAQAAGAALFAYGPVSPTASNPGRFAYSAVLKAIPGTGEPINGGPSAATCTWPAGRESGWVNRYVGVPGYQSLGTSPPPGGEYGEETWKATPADSVDGPFLVWDRAQAGLIGGGELEGTFAPLVYDNEGNFITRLPTNVDEVPDADKDMGQGGFRGSVRITPDFSHYVFSSIKSAFAPEGVTASPGSAYDNDIAADTVTLISKTESGGDIPQDPTGGRRRRVHTDPRRLERRLSHPDDDRRRGWRSHISI